MAKRIRPFLGAGILALALALSLPSCKGSSTKPADDPAPQEEQADSNSPDNQDAPKADDPMEGLAFHENDYLTIGLAGGWTVNTDVSENRHIESEKGSGYNLTVQYEDSSIGRRGFYVMVYDEPAYDWVPDYSDGSLPEENDDMGDVEALDPITIDGVMLHGYRCRRTASDGSFFWYGSYSGAVGGHYVEIFFTDGSEDNLLLEDQLGMARSVHIK